MVSLIWSSRSCLKVIVGAGLIIASDTLLHSEEIIDQTFLTRRLLSWAFAAQVCITISLF